MVVSALKAVETMGPEVRVNVYDARFAKPVDAALIRSLLERQVPIVTVEDHGPHGGFGAAVVEAASEMGLNAGLVTRMALPDEWIYQNSRGEQLKEAGLDAASIAATVRRAAAGGERELAPVVEVKGTRVRV
jgi:1-deoxy-D-xylulose-5-phosphate synthase